MDEPSLLDDERSLAAFATTLAEAIDREVLTWMLDLVEHHVPGLTTTEECRVQLEYGAATTSDEVRALLGQDIAEQRSGPLEVLRRAVRFPTEVLRQAGVAPVGRDEFAEPRVPDDIYDLTPASFRVVDPSLHEPGLIWGAAKAHVHLRRRREFPL